VPDYRDLTPADEQDLLERHMNRVTDTCIPEEEAMRRIERLVLKEWIAADSLGGVPALRRKSMKLTDLFIALVEARCAGHGLSLQTPREPMLRGSQVSFAREEGAYAIMQALIARGVIGDFRAPELLRFGFTPLYTRFVDAWDAVEHLVQVLQGGEWRAARFGERAAVTEGRKRLAESIATLRRARRCDEVDHQHRGPARARRRVSGTYRSR
jgi:hypothetical protein